MLHLKTSSACALPRREGTICKSFSLQFNRDETVSEHRGGGRGAENIKKGKEKEWEMELTSRLWFKLKMRYGRNLLRKG